MRRVVIAVVALILTLSVGTGWLAVGAGVRNGAIADRIYRLPRNGRYQLIVRVGSDGRHWGGDQWPRKAVNLWVHGRNTDWHHLRVLHIPLGTAENPQQ
jgi:hypothetical protein